MNADVIFTDFATFQHRFSIDITIPSSGFYAFIIHYISNGNSHHKIDIYIHRDFGAIYIVPCKYRFGCRQVAMKADAKVVKFFDLDKGRTPVKLFTSREAHVAVVCTFKLMSSLVEGKQAPKILFLFCYHTNRT